MPNTDFNLKEEIKKFNPNVVQGLNDLANCLKVNADSFVLIFKTFIGALLLMSMKNKSVSKDKNIRIIYRFSEELENFETSNALTESESVPSDV